MHVVSDTGNQKTNKVVLSYCLTVSGVLLMYIKPSKSVEYRDPKCLVEKDHIHQMLAQQQHVQIQLYCKVSANITNI